MSLLTPSHKTKPAHTAAPPANADGVLFTQAAHEHVEQIFDTTFTPGASTTSLGTFEVPAFGYMRHIVLLVEATGGVAGGTNAVAAADAPWSALYEVTLTDVNGQPLFGPLSGYQCYLVHLLGGYAFDSDPTRSPAYSAVANSGNFSFLLRIPVEITQRDGLGALANMNSSSTYRLRVVGGTSAAVYTTAPGTTIPTVRVRGYLEAWTDPGQGIVPPYLGTTQYWSQQIVNISSGQQTPKVLRVGNSIRNIIAVTRDNTGARVSTIMPDPVTLMLDGRLWSVEPLLLRRHYAQERYGYSSMPTGVYVIDLTHELDGHPGFELRDNWLATSAATRLEVQGSYGAAGTLTLLTNDVASLATVGA